MRKILSCFVLIGLLATSLEAHKGEDSSDLDELRHQLRCARNQIQLLEERLETQRNELKTLVQEFLDKKLAFLDQWQKQQEQQIKNQTQGSAVSLAQVREKLTDLEADLKHRWTEMAKLQGHLTRLLDANDDEKTYKVQPGDSLERIARQHKISVEHLKKANGLSKDLIVAGQELRIPR